MQLSPCPVKACISLVLIQEKKKSTFPSICCSSLPTSHSPFWEQPLLFCYRCRPHLFISQAYQYAALGLLVAGPPKNCPHTNNNARVTWVNYTEIMWYLTWMFSLNTFFYKQYSLLPAWWCFQPQLTNLHQRAQATNKQQQQTKTKTKLKQA